TGTIVTVAAAPLNQPAGIAVDSSGSLFIADAGNNVVREVIAASGALVTVAGTGTAGSSGDNGLATAAQLSAPAGVAVDASGDLFIADAGNNRVREVLSVAPPSLGALSGTAWTVNQAGFSAVIPVSGGLVPFGNLSVTGLPAGGTASLSCSTITLSRTPTAASVSSLS